MHGTGTKIEVTQCHEDKCKKKIHVTKAFIVLGVFLGLTSSIRRLLELCDSEEAVYTLRQADYMSGIGSHIKPAELLWIHNLLLGATNTSNSLECIMSFENPRNLLYQSWKYTHFVDEKTKRPDMVKCKLKQSGAGLRTSISSRSWPGFYRSCHLQLPFCGTGTISS